jgi:hypothetical protein
MKEGDKIKTVFGKIETVMLVESHRIITYESARKLCWYHPTKVFELGGSSIFTSK